MMADSVRSYGGAGGEVAVTEDLERAARIIRSVRDLLEDAGMSLSAAERRAVEAFERGSDPTRHAAERAKNALADAQVGSHGTSPVGFSAYGIGERLMEVANRFTEAERAAMSHVSAVTRAGGALTSMWGTGLWAMRHVWAAGVLASTAPLLMTGAPQKVAGAILPDGLPPTTGYLNKDTVQWMVSKLDSSAVGFPAAVYALAAMLASLEGLFGEGHATTVNERETSYAARQPTGVADVMNGLQEEENRMDGSVSIETITHADGTHSYLVTIPGTEDWGAKGDNPHDAQANLAAMVEQSTDAQMAVVDAMRAAGIKPGEEVMLAGHSQGGINAVALASRPEFLDEFNVTHVVTAGSPVGRIALPSSVNVLQLEHNEDLVSGLDAVPNPDTPTRTTVERDLRYSADPQTRAFGDTIPDAHSLPAYATTAGMVDAGAAGASASAWRDSASTFFTGETSTLTEYVPVVPPSTGHEPVDVIPQPQPVALPAFASGPTTNN
ncbi:hypothetical protein [Demequina oxidasica]|uniref:hypothetical protein n=1 Tax=Demequina oxidasica TaxID=676199 RepID=UPI0007851F45|nr:hypothetical protein [Demequina oxidasica]